MAGRPLKYNSVEELEKKVDEYFEQKMKIQENGDVIFGKVSVNGLALFLGFADKTTLYDYRDREEFSYPIKKALTIIEQYHEERLSENNVTGAIFALKNMGWKDKTEIDTRIEEVKPFSWMSRSHIMTTGVQTKES